MGKKKRTKDFQKIKLKVGKKLKKTTSTDTRIQTKKIVLLEQLTKGSENLVSHRGLSLNELCRQLDHYNMNVRRDAIIGIRQLLCSHSHLISKHLHTLIPAVGRLIACERSDAAFHAQLRALLQLLCSTNATTMSSHFALLLAHTLRALTHLRMGVRLYALTILTLLMRTYPTLCQNSIDLFDSFVSFLKNNQRMPTNKKLILDAVIAFLQAFSLEECTIVGPHHVASFSIRAKQFTTTDLTPVTRPLIDFCVLGVQPQEMKSPLNLPDEFLSALAGISSLFLLNASDEVFSMIEREWTEIFALLNKMLSRIRASLSIDQFRELKRILGNISAVSKNGNLSKRMHILLREMNLPFKEPTIS